MIYSSLGWLGRLFFERGSIEPGHPTGATPTTEIAPNGSCGRSAGAAMAGQIVPMFSAPSAHEREALDVAASYLKRAGTEAGSWMMGSPSLDLGKVELIESLRNEMRESAALCECLIDLFDGWGN